MIIWIVDFKEIKTEKIRDREKLGQKLAIRNEKRKKIY